MSSSQWAPSPSAAELRPGVVEVWRADLHGPSEAVRRLLSADERERAGRFASPDWTARWSAARGILRRLLAAYLNEDPAAVRFELGPHGKPALREPSGDLCFNVSHTGAIGLFAFALGAEVGVDVERTGRTVDAIAVARRILGASEAARLASLSAAEREREFLKAWVRHEAVVKCLGTGIGGRDDAERITPWVAELELWPSAAGAVAVAGGPHELRCWEWAATPPT